MHGFLFVVLLVFFSRSLLMTGINVEDISYWLCEKCVNKLSKQDFIIHLEFPEISWNNYKIKLWNFYSSLNRSKFDRYRWNEKWRLNKQQIIATPLSNNLILKFHGNPKSSYQLFFFNVFSQLITKHLEFPFYSLKYKFNSLQKNPTKNCLSQIFLFSSWCDFIASFIVAYETYNINSTS